MFRRDKIKKDLDEMFNINSYVCTHIHIQIHIHIRMCVHTYEKDLDEMFNINSYVHTYELILNISSKSFFILSLLFPGTLEEHICADNKQLPQVYIVVYFLVPIRPPAIGPWQQWCRQAPSGADYGAGVCTAHVTDDCGS